MSGPRDPRPGKNGAVEEGALADPLLVGGNPLENIDLIAYPAKNFVVIMKDGKIYKEHDPVSAPTDEKGTGDEDLPQCNGFMYQ